MGGLGGRIQKSAGNAVAHGSGLGAGSGARFLFRLVLSPEGGLNAVGNSWGKLLRPFVNGLVTATNGPGSSADTPAELFDGLMLVHGAHLTTVKNQRSMNKRDDLNHG